MDEQENLEQVQAEGTGVETAGPSAEDWAAVLPVLERYRLEHGLAEDLDIRSTAAHMLNGSETAARERQAMLLRHFAELQRQAEEFARVVPNFDLSQALKDERFLRYTSPYAGMTVEEAFRILHADEANAALMRTTARKTGEMIANAIACGTHRPVENGANAQAPADLKPQSYRDMTPEERAAYKRARGLPV